MNVEGRIETKTLISRVYDEKTNAVNWKKGEVNESLRRVTVTFWL